MRTAVLVVSTPLSQHGCRAGWAAVRNWGQARANGRQQIHAPVKHRPAVALLRHVARLMVHTMAGGGGRQVAEPEKVPMQAHRPCQRK